MGRAAGQFRALVWKNWLCRLRTPVLSLAEFFWPCILFMILTVLRFQEPPRHRDDCYLQPRDLPSRGVFPFVRSLLCNTGSRCRSSSHAGTTERHFRSSRFQPAAGRPEISDLDFLQEMQELAEDVYGVMGKAASLQALWAERSKSPDSSYGAGFLALDLNKTEEVISKLEQLHQQPHVWDLLRALPGLAAGAVPADDGVRSAVHLLRAVSKLLTSLEDLGWLPLDPAFARVSEIVLNATISTLTFLQECGAAATASSEASPCYEENVDWKVVSDNYFTFLNNVLKSPVASIPRVIGAIKELLTEKFHTSEDEPANSLLSFVEFLEKLLPTSFYLSSAKAVGLGVQVIKGVFDSLMPSTRSGSPEGSSRALKTVTGLLRALRKPDLDLLVDQLEQIGDSLVDFFRNVSGLGTGGSGVNLLIGLMEKLVDSSHSWDVGHLLRLSRLFPREDVSAVVDAYYVLPHAVRLLRGVVDKNITGTLQDVYDFTLRHGVRISGVTKEDFAAAIKALLNTVRLVSEKPGVLAEALTCLPVLWCRNLTTSGFQNPRSGACGRLDHTSSFYSNVASALDRLHLAPPGDVSQCSNESSQTELTRRMVCVVHGLLDWSSIFLELFRVLHTETPLGKSVREFWRKVLPFVPDSGLCPSGPLKQVALQVIEKLKDVNFTEVTSDENVFGKLASLSKILNVNDTTEASVRDATQMQFEPIQKFQYVADMCQGRGWRVKMLLLRTLLIFAENPSLAKDVVCAARSCPQGGLRQCVLCALHVATVLSDHFQELARAWSSPPEPRCVRLRGRLSSAWGRFRSGLADAGQRGCECRPALDAVGRRVHRLAQSLEKTLFSGNPVLTFLSNFTVTAAVKVKDVMGNVTRLAEELRSFAHVSDETIGRVLEADISHAPVLWSALTAALSARCDRETLRLLLAVPGPAARELCSLPGAGTYALVVTMARNLDLRSLVYKVLVPEDAKRVLSSLLDVVSGLGRLLPKAGRALELLPEFLRASEISALLDVAGAPQAPHGGREDSSAFGSFQSVMKMVCKEQEPFFSNSHTFLDLPRVGELLGGDRGKFHIPEDSTPFCLKLYQEILQSPNGALVWSFLKPILHGKILYTPDTPEINRVIQKANYTFYFVDKLKILSEMLLKISSVFPSGGNGQMLEQLQEALRNKFVRNFVESQLHIDVDELADKLQTYGGALGKLLGHAGAGRAHWLGHTLVNLSSCVALNRFRPLPSVTVLEATARELLQQNSFLASVIFHSPAAGRSASAERPRLPAHVAYTLRTSVTYSVRTDVVRNPFWKFHPQSLPADGFKYNYVFVPLQDMIETAIVLEQTGWEAAGPAARVQAAPYPCHSSDLFLNNVGFFFPLIMVLTWMVSVASMVRKLVHEREIRLEEYLRVMGVHPSTSFLAWFAENVAVLAGGCAALAAVLRASGIFAHSDAVLVFLFLLDFAVSVVMLSYLLGACFGRADMAALCASLLYVVSFLPYIVLLVLHGRLGAAAQTLLCLLSTTAFGHGVFFITFLEGQEEGLQWANVGQAPEQVGMTFAGVCWMILFDSALYFLCGWYLSSLTPGTFGSRRPWHFPFAASYWKDVCGLVVGRRHALGPDLLVLSGVSGVEGSSPQNGPGKQDGGPPGVTLVSVTKEYEPHQAAVQDLTFTFHRDQITALLGTNGAGKSTVISMLTGLCPPTSGAIFVDGRDLHAEPPATSRGLGVCLQQDVLLAGLTVREHLLLFASVKVPQWTRSDLRQQVDRTLGDVGLRPHQHTQTHALSGGLRRRLSIGIAFLGSSSTVVLDEPTSGVDTCSRRSIWDILLKYREGRTVIFTTHHLDEAEALSDRVAVLQQGGLRFCGPPAHLAAAYGQGLRLTLSRQPSDPGVDHAKDTARITALIQTHVPHAVLRGGGGRELSYALPRAADRTRFVGLFRALERDLRGLRLAGCGVSDSTLEEVFLMLLQDSKKQPDAAPGAGRVPQSPPTPEPAAGRDGASAEPPPARGARLLLGQVSALLARRFCRSRRAWKATLAHLLLPVLFVALAMALFMVRPLAVDFPPLKLSPGHYERHETYFFSESEDTGLARVLLRKFGDQDVLCADRHPDPTNSSSCWRVGPPPRPGDQGSCGCSTCPNRSAGVPYLANRLGHTLLNLSAFRLPEYLLVPSEKPRLGGWSFGERLPDAAPGANSSSSGPRPLAKVWYNQKGFHSLPSYLNHLNNLMLWRLLPPASDWRRYGITLYSHPYGGAFLNEDKILESIRQCGVALCIVLGFSILSASIGSSAVRDRVTGAKRLQHINGLGYGTYWFTNFLYDMLLHCVSVGLSVAVIAAFQLPAFTFRENLAATALLLLLFGYATLPWMYLTSRIFSNPDTAFIAYVSLNFIFGLCTMLMTTMPRLLAILSRAQNLQAIYDALRRAFAVFPQFCLGQGLIELCYNQITHDLGRGLGVDAYASPFGMGFLGWLFVLLAAQGTVLLLLRVLLHWDLAHWARVRGAAPGAAPSWKDADVERERARVLRGGAGADVLVLRDLSKRYRGLRRGRAAVRGVSLGVARGECFGLLGANGAGKSTTFKMLSGDVAPTSGHAAVRTRSGDVVALSAAGSAGVRVGYCPQQDALDQLLTGREHLRFYCSLRGVPEPRIPQVARDLVRRLHLEAHVDKPVATYSGGTKRKLSTALALLGEPDLLLLDEPSSGMDPCSKRLLWQAIREEARRGCAVVLTTHSMEECEAVCTRLAIMVDGGFRCLGSPQHVKSRFGGGFTVRVWLRGRGGRPDAVSRALQLCAPGTQLKGQRLNLLEYHVPERSGRLADLFQVLETSKALLGIRHYSVNQTTLEQVFIGFATEQLQTVADPSADGCRAGPLPV
uniref:ATP binding cassette subfamily A member 13 n=1 Tax=Rousettus aegyptiacus TaxID=9407 RepID=A0A7J8D3G6_ROUAE|nr:ATP binding cassette subfamily A member 13 [Rousettus aegyptiacus]